MSKIDCSITVNFFKEKERLTENCNIECVECPFFSKNNGMDVVCNRFIRLHTERAVKILQKWSDENLVKTRLDDFKEKYPNHMTYKDGNPCACCKHLGYTQECYDNCDKCWDMPV